jgi:hypothetical protein
VTVGASRSAGDFRFDAAAGRVFQGTREVTGSELKQINPTNPEQATSIGDGTYDTSYRIGGLAISWIPTFAE